MRFLIIISLILIVSICAFLIWAKTSAVSEGTSEQSVVVLRPFLQNEKHNAQELSVLCWNMAYAYGMASEGSERYEQITPERYEKQFNDLLEVIKRQDADIVMLQEIDFDGKRSLNQNQAMQIAKAAGYPYLAYAVSWDINYIPFPKGPKDHFGRTKSGGVILSKFKITGNKVTLYPKPKANPFWYNWFYLYRYSQLVTLEIGGSKYKIINNHLEAFDKTSRTLQSEMLKKLVNENDNVLIVAGDFNSTPTNAIKKSDFNGHPNDNYEGDGVYNTMIGLAKLDDTLPEDEYLVNESRWYTFSSEEPLRKLDYIFKSKEVQVMDFQVINSKVSDHMPIKAILKLP